MPIDASKKYFGCIDANIMKALYNNITGNGHSNWK